MGEAERLRNAACKEDKLLERMSDGRDHAWHPDTFFHDPAGDDDSLPWAVKPADILSSPAMLQRIVEAYTQSRTAEKKKKHDKKKDKKAKKSQKHVKRKEKKKKTRKRL